MKAQFVGLSQLGNLGAKKKKRKVKEHRVAATTKCKEGHYKKIGEKRYSKHVVLRTYVNHNHFIFFF